MSTFTAKSKVLREGIYLQRLYSQLAKHLLQLCSTDLSLLKATLDIDLLLPRLLCPGVMENKAGQL